MCFSSPSRPPQPVAQAPAVDSVAVEAAMAKERALALRRKGRQATIIAGVLSADSGAPKTLLGS